MFAVLHGHFYQPPRENPWTDVVPRQASARPYHDWNERITDECYRANAWSRINGASGRIAGIVNNYAALSFDFGPTLLRDLERRRPDVYRRIIEADRVSVELRGGHGNGIAQSYNHTILPLTCERDKITQVRWGMRDFEHRFGRKSEGLWLPETAIDAATLAVLAAQGVRFVILAPHQARRIRKLGDPHWHDVRWADGRGGGYEVSGPYGGRPFETGRAYRAYVGTPPKSERGRRSEASAKRPFVDVFFYDGELAGAVSFHHLLRRSEDLGDRIEAAGKTQAALRGPGGSGGVLVHYATDGEIYGHHERFGDMCLAYFAEREAPRRGIELTNYGEFLATHPPEFEVELNYGEGEGTAWSCAHGVGRWVRDCGCTTHAQPGWNQAWRGPLRAGLDAVRDEIHREFESLSDLFFDPWTARDGYIECVLDRSAAQRELFLATHARSALSREQRARAWALLEASHQAMLMYTSCAWFFADISGIEPRQNLAYAARAIELAQPFVSTPLEPRLLDHLSHARSNLPEWGDGARIYRKVLRRRLSPEVVAARSAIEAALFGRPLDTRSEGIGVWGYRVEGRLDRYYADGSKARVTRKATGWSERSSWRGRLLLADDYLEASWDWTVEIRESKNGSRDIVLGAETGQTVIPFRSVLKRLPSDLRRETGRELQEILLRETRGWIEQMHELPKRVLPELSVELSPFFRALEQTVRRWEVAEMASELLNEELSPGWWQRLESALTPARRQRIKLPLDRLGAALGARVERCLARADGHLRERRGGRISAGSVDQAIAAVAEACDLLDEAARVGLTLPRARIEERAYELLTGTSLETSGGEPGAFDASLSDRPAIRRLADHANLELESLHTPATRSA